MGNKDNKKLLNFIKLKPQQIKEIKMMYASGFTIKEIADFFDIPVHCSNDICRGVIFGEKDRS